MIAYELTSSFREDAGFMVCLLSVLFTSEVISL